MPRSVAPLRSKKFASRVYVSYRVVKVTVPILVVPTDSIWLASGQGLRVEPEPTTNYSEYQLQLQLHYPKEKDRFLNSTTERCSFA